MSKTNTMAKPDASHLRLAKGIQRFCDLSIAQQRALTVLHLVTGAQWRGERSDVALGKNTRSDHPWDMAVHSRTARDLEQIGLAETFVADIGQQFHRGRLGARYEIRCRITPAGSALVCAAKAES